MGIKIGICGAGQFAGSFIPLFQAHPAVDAVYLAEVFPDRLKHEAARFGIQHTYSDFESLCKSDVDAIVLMTQRWLHGPQAVHALKSGKHVYSAVPAAISIEEIELLLETVKSTGLTYMVGETSYYYPATIYCRKRFADGDFGEYVFGEAEYLHDMSVGFYDAYKYSGGDNWKETASFPPMLYPTHTVSKILSVTNAYMTEVACMGRQDTLNDGVFDKNVSKWQNDFSNEIGLFRSSDNGVTRISEMRRVGYKAHPDPEVRLSMFGTQASFEMQTRAASWNTVTGDFEDLTDTIRVEREASQQLADTDFQNISPDLRAGFFSGISPVHDISRLPEEFAGKPNGHEGSHQFLVLDFIEAILEEKLPPNNAWFAARCCVPGIVAHESAKRGGELMKIPDYGMPENL